MHLTSALLVLPQPGLSTAAPRISSVLLNRGAFTPPAVVLWAHFSFDLPSFKAKAGPSSDVAERTANCQAHLNFGGSTTGWQFALKDHRSKGHFQIDGVGVTLTQYLTVYFSQDAVNTATTVQSVPSTGNLAVSKDLELHTSIPEAALIWSPCSEWSFSGATRNVTAYYGASKNLSVSEQWGWTWRSC
ncbi:hypothetical protein F4823DRAFT_627736 [Ustulina deusta]|nr:hypothetical protein F4823DRAFT_627736 [Ustulina deusta]